MWFTEPTEARDGALSGQCRRFPPAVVVDRKIMTRFPIVWGTWGCGEHETE